MIASLAVKGILRGKVRFLSAVAGIAAAVGCIVFTEALKSSNAVQGEAKARRMAAPFAAWRSDMKGPMRGRGPDRDVKRVETDLKPDMTLNLASFTIDYRPDGRVLQGPPMRAVLAEIPAEFDGSPTEPQVAVTKAMFRPGMMLPEVGSTIDFVSRNGLVKAKVAKVIVDDRLDGDWTRLPGMYTGIANKALVDFAAREERGTLECWLKEPPDAEAAGIMTPKSVAPMLAGDESRNFARADAILLFGAVITAFGLLLNSLVLGLESSRRRFGVLRTAGLAGSGVAKIVAVESALAGLLGWFIGNYAARWAAKIFVGMDPGAFPEGAYITSAPGWWCLLGAVAVSVAAALAMMLPSLRVRPLDAVGRDTPVKRRKMGMFLAFTAGFGAFVAVEVWGESLMKPFVPSPEWPDAIVSFSPGVSSFDISKIEGIEGVRKISELQPLQLPFEPKEPLKGPGGGGRGGFRNALLLGCDVDTAFGGDDPIAPFKFVEGTREEAIAALKAGSCVITEMMSRARNLHKGDLMKVDAAGMTVDLPVAGVVDLNWHMVTSRAKLRGLNRASGHTDGPAFVSFDTIDMINPIPSIHVKMTHVWLNYTKDWLEGHEPLEAGQIVEAKLKKALGADGVEVQLHARDEIADGTLAHGTQIIGTLAKIPFIFLAVLSIGFIAQLVAAAEARRREFAVFRAVGATRAQIAAKLVREALSTAFKGIVLGSVFGALAGWLFTSVTRAAMSGWGIPPSFVFPLWTVIEGAIGALAISLVFAIPSACRLSTRE